MTVGPNVTVEPNARLTITAPTVVLGGESRATSGTGSSVIFHAKEGSSVHIGQAANATSFSDDFNDGNFTSNPVWTAVNKDDYPGTVSIKDNAVRLYRTAAGGNGGGLGIEIAKDINVTAETRVRFDGKAVYRSVRYGCGDTCGEFPVNVSLYLEDASGNQMRVTYVLNYGDAIKNKDEATYKQIARSVPQGEWVRDITYRIRDAWSPAVRITKIYLYGNGWDFEGYVDNIRIYNP